MEKEIEKAIRETLVVTNPQSIGIAVSKIVKVVEGIDISEDCIIKKIQWVNKMCTQKNESLTQYQIDLLKFAFASFVTTKIDKNTKEYFVCNSCSNFLPNHFSLRTENYCYLCDPNITLSELLSNKQIEKKLFNVYKITEGKCFYIVYAPSGKSAQTYLKDEFDINPENCEEIPESMWDIKNIEIKYDDEEISFLSIRDIICGSTVFIIATNDDSLID